MALKFYNNYLKNVAFSPTQRYLNDMQNSINKQWINSTQTTGEHNNLTCLMQKEIGSMIYEETDVSVDMQIDMGTGLKMSDDFKIFSHKDLNVSTERGRMYQFEDNYWITTNVDEIASPIKSISVRRCNNIAKWINPLNGSLMKQPCIIDYDVSGTSPKYDKDINTANGHIVLIIQGNKDTLQLSKNQRLLFNGEPYKITGYNNLMQNGIVDNKTTLLYFDLYVDTIEANDDVANSIANATEYLYTLDVQPDVTEQISGFSGILNTTIRLNGDVVNRNVIWSANEYGTINNSGVYTLMGNEGNVAIFTCTFGDITKTISVKIVSKVQEKYGIVINPLIKELSEGEQSKFEVYLFKDGVQQEDEISYDVYGADSTQNYTLVQNEHQFTLINNMRSIFPLNIKFVCKDISKEITILLKAMF